MQRIVFCKESFLKIQSIDDRNLLNKFGNKETIVFGTRLVSLLQNLCSNCYCKVEHLVMPYYILICKFILCMLYNETDGKYWSASNFLVNLLGMDI